MSEPTQYSWATVAMGVAGFVLVYLLMWVVLFSFSRTMRRMRRAHRETREPRDHSATRRVIAPHRVRG